MIDPGEDRDEGGPEAWEPQEYTPLDFADDDLDPPANGAGGGETGTVFGSLQEFVDGYLLALYRRAVSGNDTTWCAQWWRHTEALVRLEALWRAWEYLRLDPATGMSVWLRDHCDFHMRVLLSSDGPFKGCRPDEHRARELQPLPSTPMPADFAERLRSGPVPALRGEEG